MSNNRASSDEHAKKVSVAVLCIDYRFWPQTLSALQEKYGLFDLIAMAGASKNLISSEIENKATLLKNIEISIKLHHPERLVLTNHTDCGAYGGSGKFASHDEEISFHLEELRKAKSAAAEKFPQLKTEALIVDKNNEGKILLIEV